MGVKWRGLTPLDQDQIMRSSTNRWLAVCQFDDSSEGYLLSMGGTMGQSANVCQVAHLVMLSCCLPKTPSKNPPAGVSHKLPQTKVAATSHLANETLIFAFGWFRLLVQEGVNRKTTWIM